MSYPTVTLGSGDAALHNVPVVGYGAMGLTAFYGPAIPGKEAIKTLDETYEGGVRHFDTAEVYNNAFPQEASEKTLWNEVIVGLALKDKPRESFTVATKYHPILHGGITSPETVAEAVNNSLKRLNLGHIDLYYLHRIPSDGLEGLMQWLEGVKPFLASGAIKTIGLSEAPPAFIRAAHAVIPITAVQQEWSILTRDLERDIVPVCKELGISIVAYSPLCRAILSGPGINVTEGDWRAVGVPRFQGENLTTNLQLAKRLAEIGEAKGATAAGISIKWLLQRAKDLGITVVPIPGTRSGERAIANLKASLIPDLTEDEMAEINEMESKVAGDRGSAGYMQASYEAFL